MVWNTVCRRRSASCLPRTIRAVCSGRWRSPQRNSARRIPLRSDPEMRIQTGGVPAAATKRNRRTGGIFPSVESFPRILFLQISAKQTKIQPGKTRIVPKPCGVRRNNGYGRGMKTKKFPKSFWKAVFRRGILCYNIWKDIRMLRIGRKRQSA